MQQKTPNATASFRCTALGTARNGSSQRNSWSSWRPAHFFKSDHYKDAGAGIIFCGVAIGSICVCASHERVPSSQYLDELSVTRAYLNPGSKFVSSYPKEEPLLVPRIKRDKRAERFGEYLSSFVAENMSHSDTQ